MTRRAGIIALVVAALVAATTAVVLASRGGSGPAVRAEVVSVAGTPEADGRPVRLDATVYRTDGGGRRPAVLVGHGFGGSKAGVASQARGLAAEGYLVLAWSARGFGGSEGLVHVDSPDFEVADASRLLDALAERDDVELDAAGDPRVGVVGGSYGGGLALLLAGTDDRVDAIVPSIAWNDLEQALFPQQAVGLEAPGVFKRGWAGLLVAGVGGGRGGGPCGRLAPDVCRAYVDSAESGRPSPDLRALLAASSPRRVLGRVTAPTLLLQGQSDTLFPLSEATANAEGIPGTTPVKVVWFAGGHDGGDQQEDRLRRLTLAWLDRHLRDDGAQDTRFEVTEPSTARLSDRLSTEPARTRVAERFPGSGSPTRSLRLRGSQQGVISPPGGSPASVTSVPGAGQLLGSALSAVGGVLPDPPGQAASFETEPLTGRLRVTGAPSVRLTVTSSARDATLFVKLFDVSGDGRSELPGRLVAPVRVPTEPGVARTVDVSLPPVVLDLPRGHRLRLVVASTDQAFAVPPDTRTYRVGLADAGLVLPTPGTTAVGRSAAGPLLLTAGAMALVLVALALMVARRRRVDQADDALVEVPLVVHGLGKAYRDGYRAVSDLSFRVEPGQVLGLLGPNGAGKTTTLRMLVGLIHPTEGGLTVFGHPVRPGAPVLSRIGSFIEGPGFLPHLSGTDNLRLFWLATGRPEEHAHLETALEVAGLGDDVERTVRTYSQGMRQRLAIAQAMLGLPDLLVLDEPTNGLDPPQIREMRDVLARYAASGRTVIVSSHLLAEVEQTCTDVVVMHHGRLIAQGTVAELVGTASAVAVDVDDPERAAEVARTLPGAQDVTVTTGGLTLRLVGTPRSDLVRALTDAGVAIERLAPLHGLEEVFLGLVEDQEVKT